MKNLLFTLLVTTLFACSHTSNTNSTGNPENSPSSGVTFQFNTTPPASDMKDPANWCAARFGEAALVSADGSNYNRRLFALSTLPNRIAIDYGHITASFILQHVGNHVLISTSDNLPMCLSKKIGFTISADGKSFRYDNNFHVSFDVHIQELANGLQIAIDLPPDSGFGMLVNRCQTCK